MILFPYDAYTTWKGRIRRLPSTIDVEAGAALGSGSGGARKDRHRSRREAILELAIAKTCHTHFESTANQIEFYLLRDEAVSATPDRAGTIRGRLIEIAERERELARSQYFITRDESLIAYEASNHYYYTPVDLLEKILNCEQVIAELRSGAPIGA